MPRATTRPTRSKGRGRKRVLKVLLLAAMIGGGFVWATNRTIIDGAEGRIYESIERLPANRVALVLGTSPRVKGARNQFFECRMDAAARLFREQKVEKILVSGDNGRPEYNEPGAMKKALIGRGVPESAIVCDFAGFHTLDSIVRARRVFGVRSCTIVTDDFHLPRALHIAASEGIVAYGFPSEPLPRSMAPHVYWREVGARTQTWIDLHLLHREPKFLGPPENL